MQLGNILKLLLGRETERTIDQKKKTERPGPLSINLLRSAMRCAMYIGLLASLSFSFGLLVIILGFPSCIV